jgi:hypothetical protein
MFSAEGIPDFLSCGGSLDFYGYTFRDRGKYLGLDGIFPLIVTVPLFL